MMAHRDEQWQVETQQPPRRLTAFTHVTLDVVGTLIDFEAAIGGCLGRIVAEAGRTVDPDAALDIYRQARSAPGAGAFPDDLGRCYGLIAAALGLPDTEGHRARLVDAVADAGPFPDSVEALERLRRRYRLIAMTNARRWAFDRYAAKLGDPFHASFTTDETGCEKPDPAFFHMVFRAVEAEGGARGAILHVAQSQHHDIGVSRALGMTNVWVERRHAQPGHGGTIAPLAPTRPDFHFRTLAELAEKVERAFE